MTLNDNREHFSIYLSEGGLTTPFLHRVGCEGPVHCAPCINGAVYHIDFFRGSMWAPECCYVRSLKNYTKFDIPVNRGGLECLYRLALGFPKGKRVEWIRTALRTRYPKIHAFNCVQFTAGVLEVAGYPVPYNITYPHELQKHLQESRHVESFRRTEHTGPSPACSPARNPRPGHPDPQSQGTGGKPEGA